MDHIGEFNILNTDTEGVQTAHSAQCAGQNSEISVHGGLAAVRAYHCPKKNL